mmetsp:Transcript_22195/g.63076  ORF Transcript_22195/g.63076 Transcript_22195/m.63076 type:complete len:211 (-) Transcript_22195:1587-2219(-)
MTRPRVSALSSRMTALRTSSSCEGSCRRSLCIALAATSSSTPVWSSRCARSPRVSCARTAWPSSSHRQGSSPHAEVAAVATRAVAGAGSSAGSCASTDSEATASSMATTSRRTSSSCRARCRRIWRRGFSTRTSPAWRWRWRWSRTLRTASPGRSGSTATTAGCRLRVRSSGQGPRRATGRSAPARSSPSTAPRDSASSARTRPVRTSST